MMESMVGAVGPPSRGVGSGARTVDRTSDSAGEIAEWLRTGRLIMVDGSRQNVTVEGWSELPAQVQAEALADFQRVVRGGAKAAVIFLRA